MLGAPESWRFPAHPTHFGQSLFQRPDFQQPQAQPVQLE